LIAQSEGKIALTQTLPVHKFPSKTIMDFAYFQFLQYAKAKVALASLEKAERQALHENKAMLRALSQRYRDCEQPPPSEITWCYECARSNFAGSNGRVENLRKFMKATKLEKAPYFCSSYCKARMVENLRERGLLVHPTKRPKSNKATDDLLDDLASTTLLHNTPGLGPLPTRPSRGLTQQVEEYQRRNKLGMYKPVSILSLRNANLTLPNPMSASDIYGMQSGRMLAGINQSKENYSFN